MTDEITFLRHVHSALDSGSTWDLPKEIQARVAQLEADRKDGGISKEYPVIAWWSGGIVSAVVCKICVDWFGADKVRVVFIDTHNEHPDTYRFFKDCEKWYGTTIETICSTQYHSPMDVWYDTLSLGLAKGAKCSQVLKILVRQQFCKKNNFSHHAFGYHVGEMNRAKDMLANNSYLRPIFPAIAQLLDKKDCAKIIMAANSLFMSIQLPEPYRLGFENNNCYETGCVQGGIGYWQKIQREAPEKFNSMAKVEHDLTDMKGEPVTICKDQGKDGGLVFLKPHPKYPQHKDISMMKGREPEPLFECNGFCSPETVDHAETPGG